MTSFFSRLNSLKSWLRGWLNIEFRSEPFLLRLSAKQRFYKETFYFKLHKHVTNQIIPFERRAKTYDEFANRIKGKHSNDFRCECLFSKVPTLLLCVMKWRRNNIYSSLLVLPRLNEMSLQTKSTRKVLIGKIFVSEFFHFHHEHTKYLGW